MIFHTISGSVYECDQDNKRVRRLAGVSDPTPRQGKDGDWRNYVIATEIVVGESVRFVWSVNIDNENSSIPMTTTSMVAKIVDEEELS